MFFHQVSRALGGFGGSHPLIILYTFAMSYIQKYPASKPEDLVKRIQDYFPDIKWNSYRLVTQGWDHEVIILDDKLVFRFPNDDEYVAELRAEIAIMQMLDPLVKAPIPRYKFIAPDFSFAGYEIIPGKELTKELFDSLETADQHEIAKQLADLLSTLHSLSEAGYDFSEVPKTFLPEDQKEVRSGVEEHLRNMLDKQDLEIVDRILGQVDEVLSQRTPAIFIHGDVYSSHLLWDKTASQLGLIDFSDMCIADPAMDFAELYEYGADFVNTVYELYAGPKDSDFLKRAWIYQQWIGVYMMTDHFVYHKTSFEVARQTFDRIKT
jgi:aminoglycoside phosphotransferase (APT) family kinase protein